MYNENIKQSYNEQPNPPTESVEQLVETSEIGNDEELVTETAETDDEASLQSLWACVASEVGYGDYTTEVSLTDKISDIEESVAAKANANHTHTTSSITGLAEVATTGSYDSLSGKPTLAAVATSGNYADLNGKPAEYSHPATHPATMITGLADVATSGSYDDLTNKPTIPSVPTSLPANGGNADTVDNMHASEFAVANHTHGQYATVTHGHAVSDITGLTGELDGKAAVNHTHNYAASSHTHTAADVTETSEKKIMTAAERTKLEGIEANANNYTHPATHAATMISGLSTVATTGSYDDLSDKPTSMTPTAHNHSQSDVSGLATALSGKADTVHGHNQSDVAGLSDTLSSKANVSHTHAQTDVTGLADALSAKANATHTHTAADIGAALADHDHDEEYILKALQFTSDDGNIKYSYVATDDVLAKMADLPNGVHTCYCPVASINAPKQTEAWRFLVHKTGTSKNYGWCMAFGSRGSVYSNYIDQGNWRGWKTLHDIEPEPLWTGAMYMTSGHTVTPTKTLSQCRNGWMLLWSDYNPGEGENNYDFSVTMIPKRAYTGQVWGGGQFLCAVPSHYAADSHNYIMKCLHIHDTKIVGHESNSLVERNDVVLRAVYEF